MTKLRQVSLEDKYLLKSDQIFVTGIQALVRLPMMQSDADRLAGVRTAGYVTGYRGSPLGALDQQLALAKPQPRRQWSCQLIDVSSQRQEISAES